MLGLQQCVSNKNGTAISNPVLHRDCRTISGSTASNVFPDGGQSSPATLAGPPGSNTPQYTASPAPSGSSTPGPTPQGSNFPGAPPNSATPQYNGPNQTGPFGSPVDPLRSTNAPPFGRPNSSGPSFGSPHFASPSGAFQFGNNPMAPFPHNPMAQIGGHMMAGPQPIDRMEQGALQSVPRRHNTFYNSTEFRVHELNKRLQQRTEESDNCWWDAFATEFFEDDASLTLTFCLEDGPKRYTIGRTLIPRYFRSIFDGGVSELYFHLKLAKESFHNPTITLDCDQCTIVTHHTVKPMFTKVCTEGRLSLEFVYDDYMRIKSWHMAVRNHRELIPKSVIGMHAHSPQPDPNMLDQMSKNITRQGITSSTLNYLRLCVILEPMQELMSRHKAYSLNPRDCLKTTLFQKWQRMVAPPGKRDAQRPPNKRRKRKGSNSGSGASSAPPVPNKKRSPGPNFSLASQDVMVVGEPSLMGGEFGDEDERLITRLENTQYDSTNSMDHDNHGGFGHADSPITGGPNTWNVDQRGPQGTTPSSQDSEKKSPAVSQ